MRMLVTAAPEFDERAAPSELQGCNRIRAPRLDDELGPVVGLDFLGQLWVLKISMCFFSSSTHPLFDAAIPAPSGREKSLLASRTRR